MADDIHANTNTAMRHAGGFQGWWCPICGQRVTLSGEVLGSLVRGRTSYFVLVHRDCNDLVERCLTVDAAWAALAAGAPVDLDRREYNPDRAKNALKGVVGDADRRP